MSLWPDVKLIGSIDVNLWTRGIFRAEAHNAVRNKSVECPAIIRGPSTSFIELKDDDWIVSAVIIFEIFWLIVLIKKGNSMKGGRGESED